MTLPAPLVAQLVQALPLADPIEVVDVGASNLASSGRPAYEPLLDLGLARLTAFEPNPAELARLRPDAARRYLPHVIGDGAPATLYLTRHPGFSSTLRPDPAMAAHLHSFPALMSVTSQHEVATRRLDDLAELPRIDFLKIDIQGGELAAFQGGAGKLASALCVHTEVAFLPIYLNQPLFADQDAQLQRLGLRFHGLASVNRFPHPGTPTDLHGPSRQRDLGQWVDADAVYLADVRRWDGLAVEPLKRLFFILALCYPAISATLSIARRLVSSNALNPAMLDQLQDAYRHGAAG